MKLNACEKKKMILLLENILPTGRNKDLIP